MTNERQTKVAVAPPVESMDSTRVPPEQFIKTVIGFEDRGYISAPFSHIPSTGTLASYEGKPLTGLRDSPHTTREHVCGLEGVQSQVAQGKPAASSFRSETDANNYTALTIDANRSEVAKFLDNPIASRRTIAAKFNESVGFGVTKQHPDQIFETSHVRCVLVKSPDLPPRSFAVYTSMPDISDTTKPGSTGNQFMRLPAPTSFYGTAESATKSFLSPLSWASAAPSSFSSPSPAPTYTPPPPAPEPYKSTWAPEGTRATTWATSPPPAPEPYKSTWATEPARSTTLSAPAATPPPPLPISYTPPPTAPAPYKPSWEPERSSYSSSRETKSTWNDPPPKPASSWGSSWGSSNTSSSWVNSFTASTTVSSWYGSVPGGLIICPEAKNIGPITSIRLEPSQEGRLIINDKLIFDTNLSGDEVAILYDSIFVRKEGLHRFGVTSPDTTVGTDPNNIVGITLRLADYRFLEVIFGKSPQSTEFARTNHPEYENPEQALVRRIKERNWDAIQALSTRASTTLGGYFFFEFKDVAFNEQDGRIVPENGQMIIHPVVIKGSARNPTYVGGEEHFKKSFPEVFDAIRHIKDNLEFYIHSEPYLAKLFDYAAAVALFRAAAMGGATIAEAQLLDEFLQYSPTTILNHHIRASDPKTEMVEVYREGALALQAIANDPQISLPQKFEVGVSGFHLAQHTKDDSLLQYFDGYLSSLLGKNMPDSRVPRTLVEYSVKVLMGHPSALLPMSEKDFNEQGINAAVTFQDAVKIGTKELLDWRERKVYSVEIFEALRTYFSNKGMHDLAAYWKAHIAFRTVSKTANTLHDALEIAGMEFIEAGGRLPWIYAVASVYLDGLPRSASVEQYLLEQLAHELNNAPSAEALCIVLSNCKANPWITEIFAAPTQLLLTLAARVGSVSENAADLTTFQRYRVHVANTLRKTFGTSLPVPPNFNEEVFLKNP